MGFGAEMDKKKATQYYELAAMNGDVMTRRDLGCTEVDAGKIGRARNTFYLQQGQGINRLWTR